MGQLHTGLPGSPPSSSTSHCTAGQSARALRNLTASRPLFHTLMASSRCERMVQAQHCNLLWCNQGFYCWGKTIKRGRVTLPASRTLCPHQLFPADALLLPLPCCCPQRMLPCYWQRERKPWGGVWAGSRGLAVGQTSVSHCGACCARHSPGNRNCNLWNRKLKTPSAEMRHVAPE